MNEKLDERRESQVPANTEQSNSQLYSRTTQAAHDTETKTNGWWSREGPGPGDRSLGSDTGSWEDPLAFSSRGSEIFMTKKGLEWIIHEVPLDFTLKFF